MSFPSVSVVIPMFNEEKYIGRCLNSLVAQDYAGDIEIIIVDGGSTDRSREIVEDYARKDGRIRLLNNPYRHIPHALNIGIQNSRGEIIVRADAHTTYAPDYVSECVRCLTSSEASNVGGLQRAIGEGYWAEAIAAALNTPFAAGDAYYRFLEQERWVDTVFLGAWWKQTLEEMGGFNEEFLCNQDYELNYRLRKKGGKILLSPQIKCWYYVRPSLKSLARQYFRYGFWKVKTLMTYPDSLRWRQLVPPTFVLSLIGSAFVASIDVRLGLVVPLTYLGVNLVASTGAALRKGSKYLPALPLVYGTIHLSWGVGFWCGLFKWMTERIVKGA